MFCVITSRAAFAALFFMTAASHVAAQAPAPEAGPSDGPRTIPLPSQQTRGTVPTPQSGAPRGTAQSPEPDDRDDPPQFSPRHDSRSSRREEREYQRERSRKGRDTRREGRDRNEAPRRPEPSAGTASFGDSVGTPVWLDRACAPDRDQRVTAYVTAIEQKTTPTGDQLKALEELRKAAASAGELLRAGCEGGAALTPTRQIEVVERRAKAIISAVDVLKPALEAFYAGLDDEQKARFVTLATPGGASATPNASSEQRPRTDSASRPLNDLQRSSDGERGGNAEAGGTSEEASEPRRKSRRSRRYRYYYRW